MSMEDYEAAAALIKAHPEEADFAGPREPSVVEAAERALGVTFPPSYRRFLLEYGAGGFGSMEIFGVIDDNFETGPVPDGIWLTLSERQEAPPLPDDLVVVSYVGDGTLECLHVGAGAVEAPVVFFEPGLRAEEQQPYDVEAEDFGRFLLKGVRQVLARQRAP
jgi:hypothetical protein